MNAEPTKVVNMIVTSAAAGTRLDRLLADHLPGVARKRAGQLIEAGRVRVDGHRYTKSYCPSLGQTIEVVLGDSGDAQPAPQVPLRVLSESDDVVVIDKPAGLPSAALPDSSRATAAGALLARYPEMSGVGFGPREPGLIHRLDTFTSGVLVAARSTESFVALRSALAAGTLQKRYLALVASEAIDEQGVIEAALGADPKNRRRVCVVPATQTSKPTEFAPAEVATTYYRTLRRGRRWALVEARAGAAYRHQIRAHLAYRGSPLLGDVLYGGAPIGLGERHALHASFVGGTYTKEASRAATNFGATAPLPDDMRRLLHEDGVTDYQD